MPKHCGHIEALTSSGRKIHGISHCPDCLLAAYNALQDEFDLRLVEGDGPHVVHVPTWERMQPAVDAMGTTVARLCAEIAEPVGKGAMMSNVGPAISAEIRATFKV